MKEIGKKLQEKRQQLKMSYQDVSNITKLTESHIRAIEEGDFDHFKNDLTYLRFYIRAYCKAVDLPFEEFKDEYEMSMNDYTTTLSLKAIKETEEVEEKIISRINNENLDAAPILAKKDRGSIKTNVKQSTRFRKKNVDISLVSLLLIVVVIIGILVFVLFSNVLGSSDDGKEKDPESVQKVPEKEKEKEPEVVVPKKEEFISTLVSATGEESEYKITGLKAGAPIKIEFVFGVRSWFVGSLNNQKINSVSSMPSERPLEIGETATYEGVVGANDSFTFFFGDFQQITLKINDKEVVFDPTTKAVGGLYTIKLNVVGE